jgi:hypothetical protein
MNFTGEAGAVMRVGEQSAGPHVFHIGRVTRSDWPGGCPNNDRQHCKRNIEGRPPSRATAFAMLLDIFCKVETRRKFWGARVPVLERKDS